MHGRIDQFHRSWPSFLICSMLTLGYKFSFSFWVLQFGLHQPSTLKNPVPPRAPLKNSIPMPADFGTLSQLCFLLALGVPWASQP